MDCLCSSSMWQFGQTYGFIIQSGVIAVSAFVAVLSIHFSKQTAKKRATIDAFLKFRDDQKVVDAKAKIKAIHDDAKLPENGSKLNANLKSYASKIGSDEFNAILAMLNYYEFISAGIFEGAFDEDTFKRMQYKQLDRDYDTMIPFVVELRKNKAESGHPQPTMFQEFERLGARWKKNPLKVHT